MRCGRERHTICQKSWARFSSSECTAYGCPSFWPSVSILKHKLRIRIRHGIRTKGDISVVSWILLFSLPFPPCAIGSQPATSTWNQSLSDLKLWFCRHVVMSSPVLEFFMLTFQNECETLLQVSKGQEWVEGFFFFVSFVWVDHFCLNLILCRDWLNIMSVVIDPWLAGQCLNS